MVNVPGKSRGCAICRKRKCDQLLPECIRCIKSGVACPGARTEAFFVHTVFPGSLPTSSTSSPHQILQIRSGWKLPGPQPARSSSFDQLFVSHFIDSFFGSTKPPPIQGTPPKIWLHELPSLAASSTYTSARHSIRAASMLSYGVSANDASIKAEACRWYMLSLRDLHCQLSHSSQSFPDDVVCAVVMLIHFETLAGTCHKAWLQHVKGVAVMLEAGGPEQCRSGFLHQLFSHVRLQTFFAAMADSSLHRFASPEWMTVPFEIYPKLVFDRLVDILFSMQKCLAVAHRLILSRGGISPQGEMQNLETLLKDAVLQLHEWRLAYISNSGTHEATVAAGDESETFFIPFTSIPEAALISLYDAANVVILRLLLLVSSSAATYDARIRRHAESILTANELINALSASESPDRGSIMVALQLKLVSLWSPCRYQRQSAWRMLYEGKQQNGGLADISRLCNGEYFADVAVHLLHYDVPDHDSQRLVDAVIPG